MELPDRLVPAHLFDPRRAGFEPAESVALWHNMAAAGGGQPPEFMSTHPSHGRRIESLRAAVPAANQLRDAARARGLRPACQ